MIKRLFSSAVIVGITSVMPDAAWAASCSDLAKGVPAGTTVTIAAAVAPGAFTPPAPGAAAAYAQLPEFCRVAATLRPTNDSDIKIEVWMPAAGWNGKFQAVGNGGWAGTIPYQAMATALAAGYATAGTDTGHTGGTASFALGHTEKVVDLGYRAVHEMTVQAKKLIDRFYGSAPKLSVWNGCSQGGRQGITEAVRYPADYDGVIAGAPAVNWMHLHAGRMAANRAANRTAAASIPREKYALIHDAVLTACDANDGVKDGLVENPLACRFDPQVLQCKGDSADGCLTAAQVESAKALYAPVLNPRSGEQVLPGLVPGSELAWATAAGAQPVGTAFDAYRFIVFQNANWDPATFNSATDIDRALQSDKDDVLDSSSTNLEAFFRRGGKLLMYHGWSDTQVTPLNSINYFQSVTSRFGHATVGKSIQLYMVPGMNHCQGGDGTDRFDKVAALEQWIASGTAPDRITASHQTGGVIDRTRPLCAFGQIARWTGTGSTDDAANFACVADTTRPPR